MSDKNEYGNPSEQLEKVKDRMFEAITKAQEFDSGEVSREGWSGWLSDFLSKK